MANEIKSSRFSGPSDAIDMEKLEKETQKLFFSGATRSGIVSCGTWIVFYVQEDGGKSGQAPVDGACNQASEDDEGV